MSRKSSSGRPSGRGPDSSRPNSNIRRIWGRLAGPAKPICSCSRELRTAWVSWRLKGRPTRPSAKSSTIWLGTDVDKNYAPELKGSSATLSSGKWVRLKSLCETLGLDTKDVMSIRYQLLHRTVAALLEAKRSIAAKLSSSSIIFQTDQITQLVTSQISSNSAKR